MRKISVTYRIDERVVNMFENLLSINDENESLVLEQLIVEYCTMISNELNNEIYNSFEGEEFDL